MLYTHRLGAWALPDAEWQLIHHPEPLISLEEGLVSFASEATWDEEGVKRVQPASSSFRTLFGTDGEWPGPD